MLSKKLALPMLLTLTFSSAYGAVVFRKDHWFIDDLSSSSNPNGPCMMVTQNKQNNVTYRLEIVRPKNADGPIEIQIRQLGRGAVSQTAAISNGKTLAFSTLSTDGNNSLLYNLPQGSTALIDYLSAGGELRLRPADGTRDRGVNFEDGGFNTVKAEYARRCLGGRQLVDTAFESAFLKAQGRVLNPNALNATSVAELQTLLKQGHASFKEIGANQAQIAQLRDRFASQLNEAQRLGSEIGQLSNMITEGREEFNRAEVTRLTAQIAQLTPGVQAATTARDRAESIVAPLRPEHDRYASAASDARSSANNAQAEVRRISSEIGSLEQQIRQLGIDRSNALAAADSADRNLRPARMNARRATLAYDDFARVAEREIRRLIVENPRWREAQAALPEARRAEDELEKLRDAAHDDKERKENIKEACERLRRNVPTTDCSAQIAEHAAALQLYRTHEANEDRAQARRYAFETTITNIENDARNRVNAELEALRIKMVAANQEVRELEDTITSAEATARRIAYETIPNLNQRIDRLEDMLPAAEAASVSEAGRANATASALASYENRVGWDAKVQALENAQNVLNQRSSELRSSQRSLTTAQQTLGNIADWKNQRQEKQDRLAVVNASLEPFNAENARLQNIAGDLGAKFQGLVEQFDTKLL